MFNYNMQKIKLLTNKIITLSNNKWVIRIKNLIIIIIGATFMVIIMTALTEVTVSLIFKEEYRDWLQVRPVINNWLSGLPLFYKILALFNGALHDHIMFTFYHYGSWNMTYDILKWVSNKVNFMILYHITLIIYCILILLYGVYKIFSYNEGVRKFTTVLFILFIESVMLLITYQDESIVTSSFELNNVIFSTKIMFFYYDTITILFLITIFIISFIVSAYQKIYLFEDLRKDIFLIVFNIFILSMVIVVSTTNWALLTLGWEALGLSSFFLIGYFLQKPSSMKSACKAFFYNKISDVFLLLGIAIHYKIHNTFFFNAKLMTTPDDEFIIFCVLLTAFVKSAQLVFYFWLPDSMEAPIPASALIHSATLVSAGIYLILRFKAIAELSLHIQLLTVCVSLSTMVLMSWTAAHQTDIKKLLAYSTIANCSFIFILIYLKMYHLALVYFIIHGILKSCSFIVAGSLILANNHSQDFRNWSNFTFTIKIQILLLCLLLFLLSGMPISIVYNVKMMVKGGFAISWFNYLVLSLGTAIYTINSYVYSIKVFMFFIRKKWRFNKIRRVSQVNTVNEATTASIIGLYVLLILVSIAVIWINTSIYSSTLTIDWVLKIILLALAVIITSHRNWYLGYQIAVSFALTTIFII